MSRGPQDAVQILIFAHAADIGGANQAILTLIEPAAAERFVYAVAVPCEGRMAEAVRERGVPVVVIGRADGYFAGQIPVIRRTIVRRRPDLVHVNSFSGSSRNVCISSILAGRPYLWHLHETLPDPVSFRTHIFLRFAARLIACSAISRAQFAALLPPSKHIDLVYNAVSIPALPVTAAVKAAARARLLTEFNRSPDARVIVTVGRVIYDKGQDLLLEAAAEVVKAFSCAVFLVVGDHGGAGDPYFQALESAVSRHGLEKNIVFTGYRRDAEDLILGADLMVHPSRKESFGLVLGEALARLTPAVAFRIGGIPEIIDHDRNGCLVTPFHSEEMGRTVTALLADDDRRTAMAECGREDVLASFSAAGFKKQMTAIYSTIAGRQKGSVV